VEQSLLQSLGVGSLIDDEQGVASCLVSSLGEAQYFDTLTSCHLTFIAIGRVIMCQPFYIAPRDHFPETYVLVCPEIQQVRQLICSSNTLENFCKPQDSTHAWFWNTFATPVQGTKRTQHFQPKSRLGGQSSLLERLPVELIDNILDTLVGTTLKLRRACTEMQDVLALGSCSPVLYPIVLSWIHRSYRNELAPTWASKSVGFHGTESNLMTELESYGIPKLQSENLRLRSKSHWVWWPRTSAEPELFWSWTITSLREKWCEMETNDWDQIHQDISQEYMYPQDRTWVLRNLTTKQIVRSDSLTPPLGISHEKLLPDRSEKRATLRRAWSKIRPTQAPEPMEFPPLSLPQIFLILTANSTTLNSHQETLMIRKGPWTTHTFDVITLEQHLSSEHEADWLDVSKLVVADMGHLRWCIEQFEALHEVMTREPKRLGNMDVLNFRARMTEQRRRWHAWAEVIGQGL
jgi:hypothetical protein